MNRSISALSRGPSLGERGEGKGSERSRLPSFSSLANTRPASKVSLRLFTLSEFVSFSCLSASPPTLPSRAAFVTQRREEEQVEEEERRGEWLLLFRTDGILCLSGGAECSCQSAADAERDWQVDYTLCRFVPGQI